MKKLLLLFLSIALSIVINGQAVTNVTTVGVTFSPADITVNQGDIVRFTIVSPHDATQVSQATYNANGTTPLPGGFAFSAGTSNYTASTPGIIYYVCTVHVAAFGMKGTITVNAVTGIEDNQAKNGEKVFPNPAADYIIYQNAGNLSIKEIRILDIVGKTVKIVPAPVLSDDGQLRINIDNLDKGMYFLVVKSAHGTNSKKFLKTS